MGGVYLTYVADDDKVRRAVTLIWCFKVSLAWLKNVGRDDEKQLLQMFSVEEILIHDKVQ